MYPSFSPRALGIELTWDASIDVAAALGFRAVDLLVRDLVDAKSDLREIRLRLDDRGLTGGAFPLPVDWRGDEANYRRDLLTLPRYAAAAAQLGLVTTGTWVRPYTTLGLPDGTPEACHAAEWSLHVNRLSTIASILNAHGLKLGLEVLSVYRIPAEPTLPFIRTLSDLDPLLSSIRARTPGAGLLVDAFHLHAGGENLLAYLGKREKAEVVWVHLADRPAHPRRSDIIEDDDRALPGESGTVDASTLLQILKHHAYSGPVTVETLRCPRPLADMPAADIAALVMDSIRTCWPPPSH